MKRTNWEKAALSMIVCLALVFALLPATAQAAGDLSVVIDTGASITLQDTDSDGAYEIGTADALYAFAAAVNSGQTSINGELTADIVVNTGDVAGCNGTKAEGWRDWMPIGNLNNKYVGTFDGGSHIVSGLYFNNSAADYVGLFGYAGTVQSVGVVNSYISGNSYVGGVVGYISSSSTATNCYNTGTVTGTSARVGGVVGTSYKGTVKNCHNTGAVTGYSSVGGVVGWNNNGTVANCYNTGGVTATGDNGNVGGVVGYNYTATVTNCYNTGAVTATGDNGNVGGVAGKSDSNIEYCCSTGNVSGSNVGGVVANNTGTVANCYYLADSETDSLDGTTAKTAEQFASGEVAYLLNGSTSEGDLVWGQNIDNSESIQIVPTFTGAQVYSYTDCCGRVCYSNTNAADGTHEKSTYTNGFRDCCGEIESAVDSDGDGYYEISNAGQLYWFADKVNNDNANFGSANAVLTANIVVNTGDVAGCNGTKAEGWRDWTPIGSNGNIYNGTFDGGSFTVSGLYLNNSTTDYVGLFGFVNTSGTVQNVGVVNSCFSGKASVGAIAGSNNGAVQNCFNTGTVSGSERVGGVVGTNNIDGDIINCYNTGAVSGSESVGGVVGSNANGHIINCYNTGAVTGSFPAVGGVAGDASGFIWNCYNIGTVVGCGNVGGVVGEHLDELNPIINCYYRTGCAKDTNDEETPQFGIGNSTSDEGCAPKEDTAFSTGEVAYLLWEYDEDLIPKYDAVWGQNIGTENYPVLGGKQVYYGYLSCGDAVYTNDPNASDTRPEHSGKLSYEDNGNGTHTGTYSCCGGIVTENHDYGESHTCVCGKMETFTVYWSGGESLDLTTSVSTYGQDFVENITIPENTHLEIESVSNKDTRDEIPYTYANGVLTIAAENIPAADIEIICSHYVEAKYDANGGVIKPVEGYENDDGFASDGSYWILKIEIGGNVYPINLHTVTREGYTFVDWRDASGKVYPESKADGATVVTATTDVVIYAQWQCNHTIGGVEFRDNDNGTHSGYCGECGEPLGHYVEQPHNHTNGKCVCGRKATPAVTAPTANTLTYTGEAQTLIAAGSTTGGTLKYSLDNANWSTEIPSATNAGEYTVYYKVVGNENYEDIAAQSVTVTVTPMNVSGATVTLGTALTYNGAAQTQTVASVTLNGLTLTAGDYTVTGDQQTDAGDYTLTVTGKGNFTGSVTKDWSIAKAPMTITADNVTVLVGRDAPAEAALTYTVTGLVGGDTAESALSVKPVLSYSATPDTTQEGSYTIAISGATADNYDITHVDGTLTVSEKTPVTITVNLPANLVYNAADLTSSITANITAVVTDTGDAAAISAYDYAFSASPINAGSYTLTVSVAGSDAQYAGSVTIPFTIAQRPLTLKADNKTALVNGSEPEYTVTAAGLVSGHSVSGASADCAGADMTTAGTYDITVSAAGLVITDGVTDVTANYAVTTENGTLTVSTPYTPPVVPVPAPTVTVPVSGDNTRVQVEVTVTGEKATVGNVKLEALETVVDGRGETVTIDFSALTQEITAVELPVSVVETIAEAAAARQMLEIVFSDNVSIAFNASALHKQVQHIRGTTITISILPRNDARLTPAQQAAVGDRPAYDISLTSGGRIISSMGDRITVTVPYELRNGEKADGLVVCYVDENGGRERCDTRYDAKNKRLSWQTDHLSVYMIDYDETLAETCDGGKDCPLSVFADLNGTAWYHDGVHFCIENDLMNGITDSLFSPDGTTTRAQIVTILWRLEGEPAVDYLMQFDDVAADKWYTEAVRWAAAGNIVGGYGDGKFGPGDAITREQMAAILYRYCRYKGIDVSVGEDTNILSYTDAFDIREYAIPAMQWACGSGVISGIADGDDMKLDPCGSAKRAQVATILWRFCENVLNG